MFGLHHDESSDGGLEDRTGPNEFRIGIVGQSGCGKSSIVVRLHQVREKLLKEVSQTQTECPAKNCFQNKVLCVPVSKGENLGIKIEKSKRYTNWCCVGSFISNELASCYSAIQRDGRVAVGDLIIAIGNVSLVHKTPFEVVGILKGADYGLNGYVLITFMRPEDQPIDSEHDTTNGFSYNDNLNAVELDSSQSSSSSSHHLSESVCIDRPTVFVTRSFFCYSRKPVKPPQHARLTSYHMISDIEPSIYTEHRNLSSIVEIVDIPGSDSKFRILREWYPRLDSTVLVYSADNAASLLALENIYMRQMTKMSAKEAYELSIVVVCTKYDICRNRQAEPPQAQQKQDVLVAEGLAIANVWNAPFFVVSSSSGQVYEYGLKNGQCWQSCFYNIFEKSIQQTMVRSQTAALAGRDNSVILPSFLQLLPFVSECMGELPDPVINCRKLQPFDNIPVEDECEDKLFFDSEELVSDCYSDYLNLGSTSANNDNETLNVVKKTGDTHDIWKVNDGRWDSERVFLNKENSVNRPNHCESSIIGSE